MIHSENCIFCKIAAGTIPAVKIFENEFVFVIKDINPLAEHHYLVISKQHVVSLNDADARFIETVVPKVFLAAATVAQTLGFKERGYRVVINNQSAAGQSVWHTHWHVLSAPALGVFA